MFNIILKLIVKFTTLCKNMCFLLTIYKKKLYKLYLNNKDLYCEIIVSKSQGKLTKEAELMLELLAKKTIKKMRYRTNEDRLDCYQSGLLDMFQNWYNFNEEKSVNAFAYFTEIFKRGLAKGYNELYKKKGDFEHRIKMISIEGSNDGKGLHSI